MGAEPQADLSTYRVAPIRLFGDDLAPPRPLYFMYFPAVLILAGALSWTIGNDDGFAFGCVAATVISVYTLWQWLFRRAPTRFSTLLAMSLLLGYGGGALNTWLTLPRGPLALSEVMGLGRGVLARGIAAVLFSSALLYFFGEIFEKPLFGQSFRLQIDSTMRSLINLSAVGMLLGYAAHALVIEGPASKSGHVSIPGLFIDWIYGPAVALSIPAFLTAKTGRERVLAGLSSIVLLLLFAVLGRRVAVYSTVLILFALGLTGYAWRGKAIRNAILIGFFGAIIAACGLVFMLLRISPLSRANIRSPTIATRVAAANKLVKRGDALAVAVAATRQNVQRRTFVIAFLANVLDAASTRTPALGRDAEDMIDSTIPRAIDPNKVRFFTEEGLVDQQFGFGYGDEANSVLTGGATDFGLMGVLIYPLILIVVVRAVYEFLAMWLMPIPLLIVSLSLIGAFLPTEATLSAYSAGIRNEIIFGIIIQILLFLPRFRLRQQYTGRLG